MTDSPGKQIAKIFFDTLGAAMPGEWAREGLCTAPHVNPDWWHGDKGEQALAVTICARCPARHACAEFSLETKQPEGVWGGLSADDRGRLLREGVA